GLSGPGARVRPARQQSAIHAPRHHESEDARRAEQRRPLRGAAVPGEIRLPGGRRGLADDRPRGDRAARSGGRHRTGDREPHDRPLLIVDSTAFLRLVERGELPPVLLLHGPDVQLLDDALALVTGRLFPDVASAALGREVLDGGEVDARAVVTSAMTLPLLGGVRLVVVRHAQALGPQHAESLGAYARDPNPATRLVLLADEALRASRDRRADHWVVQA